ncbi:MAG TPA: zf-HC2 domain-containing protein, partial [Vicinamibacterales bacterium]|nr:zf-HC2 domain-containing protein [Vicinamibacterales bacterium]
MNCQDYDAQIGDYVDGAMDEAQRASFESHLATCASCRAVVADFSVIRSASLSLVPQVPAPHVWRKLSAAIDAEPKPFFGVGGMQWWRAFAPAAAAAILVASLSWTAARLTSAPGERLARITPVTPSEPVSILAEYQLAERDLTDTIEGLERIAATDPAALDMETADVLKANLTVLDGAIGESRDALKKEPENDVAQESLFEALRNKVALLQDTIALINEMRKGNQEGAARIVSGL